MRLVDADALEVVGTVIPSGIDEKSYVMGMEYILNKIDSMPTIEERKKGKWISRVGREDCYECSECHAVIEGNEVYWRNNYFCYHCGADMRERREE